jgi:hypothetical protein
MKHVDAVRGFQRDILFNPDNLYTTGGGLALTNCVVEADEHDWQGKAPVLSLRFYHKPSTLAVDEDTAIGVEISLGLEMAQSLIQQINDKWPELVKMAQEEKSDPDLSA